MKRISWSLLALLTIGILNTKAQQTQKPPLHGKEWMAITGKPMAGMY